MTDVTFGIREAGSPRPVQHTLAAGHALVLGAEHAGVGVRILERGWPLSLAGRRLDRRGPAARVRAGLVVIDDRSTVAAEVSVGDHLAAIAGGATRLLDDAPLLAGRGGDPAGVLSGGERRVLRWLCAIALQPRLVVLDGAGAGLDAATLAWCTAVVGEWTRAGVARIVRVGRAEESPWGTQPPG